MYSDAESIDFKLWLQRQQLGHHSLDQVKEYIEAMIGDSTKEFRDQHKAI